MIIELKTYTTEVLMNLTNDAFDVHAQRVWDYNNKLSTIGKMRDLRKKENEENKNE